MGITVLNYIRNILCYHRLVAYGSRECSRSAMHIRTCTYMYMYNTCNCSRECSNRYICYAQSTNSNHPRILLCKARICMHLLGSWNQTSAIRGNKPTIDRACKAVRPSTSMKTQSIMHVKQFSHPRQRSHDE